MVRTIVGGDSANEDSVSPIKGIGGLLREKVVAETAMLLLCAEPIQSLDDRIQERVAALATLLIPYARHEDILCAICLDPGLARDHSIAHILLSHLGYPDRDVDKLLAQSLAMGADFGPERLPHRRLEQEWLTRLWSVGAPSKRRDSRLLAQSLLGRPMDALGSTRLDIYAFTHAVMYASDLGGRKIPLPRSSSAIAADADAALAYSLDSNNFDLTAEVLLTWPMLGLAWSPAAAFAFRLLAGVEDNVGFLPGPTFDFTRYRTLTSDEQSRYGLVTSYHSAYAMGFLCASALRQGCGPPAAVPPARRSRGVSTALLRLLDVQGLTSCWREQFGALAPRQQDAVARLVLTTLLRRARTAGDLGLIRTALELALAHDLIDGPAPMQAAALLHRSQALKVESALLPRTCADTTGKNNIPSSPTR